MRIHPYFDLIKDTILFINKRGIILYANPAFENLTGYQKTDVLDKSIDQLRLDEEFKEIFWSQTEQLEEGMTYQQQFIRPGRSGISYYDVELMVIKNELEFDKNNYYIVSVRNITSAIDKTEQIKAIEHELLKATDTLKQLLYRSSHDFRSPVSTIRGLIALAMRITSDTEIINYLNLIALNCNKMDSLLLAMRKIYAIHLGHYKDEEIDFNKLVNKILHHLKQEGLLSGAKVNLHIAVKGAYSSYKFPLERILQNLMDNALRYRRQSPLKEQQHVVTLSIESKEDGLQITVADNGIGIDETISPRIFDMFFKGEPSHKTNGLGLFIVKTAVEKLNGRIDIESIPTKGTTVKISLPGS